MSEESKNERLEACAREIAETVFEMPPGECDYTDYDAKSATIAGILKARAAFSTSRAAASPVFLKTLEDAEQRLLKLAASEPDSLAREPIDWEALAVHDAIAALLRAGGAGEPDGYAIEREQDGQWWMDGTFYRPDHKGHADNEVAAIPHRTRLVPLFRTALATPPAVATEPDA